MIMMPDRSGIKAVIAANGSNTKYLFPSLMSLLYSDVQFFCPMDCQLPPYLINVY